MENTMLEPLLESPVKEKILLFIYSGEESYAREISRTFDLNLHTVQNQLLKLEAGGILFSKLRGRVRLFGLNPRYPFKKELGRLLEKVLAFLPPDDVERFYLRRVRPRRTGKPF